MAGLAEILEENRRLREALRLKDERIQAQQLELTKRAAMIEAIQARVEELAQKLALLQQKASGPSSQRFVPEEQDLLPFPGDIEPPPRAPQCEPADEESEQEQEPKKNKDGSRKKKPRRRKRSDFDHMASRTVTCHAPEGQTCSTCNGVLGVVGQACSFRVEWVPGHFVIDDVTRDKCACRNAECPDYRAVLTVPAPYALDRALCADGLLARVIIDKFDDHLPLNRQAKRMGREGFTVGTNTLSGWVLGVGRLLARVALAVRDDLLAGPFLQADDTGHPIQDAGDGTLRKGRMWVFTDQQQAYYAFTPTKEGHFPAQLIDGFAGDLLLVDAGSEFNKTVRDHKLSRGGCWSHLRSYFWDARLHYPGEAALALGTLRDLFMFERTVHGLKPEQVRAERQKVAKPLVDGFFAWAKALSTTARPTSTLGDALRYARNQEATLRLFLEHGELPIHNNLSELMLRQNVVGRKNWLFSRSEGGAEVAATLYTLIGSCKLQGIDPHEYLVDILSRIQDHPASRVAELTPKGWRLAKEGSHGT